ncbi:MAG: NADH-quinone oxidoreductase subunit N [Sporomusaceae bacterium]|nr:NADH-quinone oxidoreductase subunit N [Sporomusaceae bacterium]
MNFSLLTVEMLTAGLALSLLLADLLLPPGQRRQLGCLALAGLGAVLVYALGLYGSRETFYQGLFRLDDYAVFFKQLFLLAAILTIGFSFDYVERLQRRQGEFYFLLLLTVVGMMLMAAANDFLTLYVGMELMAVSFFILTGMGSGCLSSEAGLKYLLIGAASTAVFLFGVSLLFGAAGSFAWPQLMSRAVYSPAALTGMALVFAGLLFKVASVPFHMWAPDVYEGAPVPVTAMLAMASKAAGFAALTRLAMQAADIAVFNWPPLIAALAALSMVAGNLLAIAQTNLKRLLAYSSIAQAGYLLAGLAAAGEAGVKGLLFYAMVYVFANAGAFAVVTAVHLNEQSDEISAYSGLARRAPLLAAAMTVSLLSMAGIPVLAGFVGKFYLFSAAVDNGLLWLAFLGFVMSMLSVYYYLMVVKSMYLGQPPAAHLPYSGGLGWVALVSMTLTVLCGLYPEPLARLAAGAAKALF